MNKFMNGLKNATNYIYTDNGALAYKSTGSDLYDMFAHGAAMRRRDDADCIVMFRKAFAENPVYALKCLFYIRDVLQGQGERRFFRVCMKDLAFQNPEAAKRNMKYIPEFGRWDDLYVFVGTPLEADAFAIMREQLNADVQTQYPSLLAKWLKSENSSSKETRRLGDRTRRAFNLTHKQYRKTLSILRERINVLERLMSANKWDEIEFDKIPSVAGIRYKKAFIKHDVERQEQNKSVQTYEEFAKSADTKVNAKALYPYDVVSEALHWLRAHSTYSGWRSTYLSSVNDFTDTDRLMVNKYWDNLTEYFADKTLNGIVVADTSGSMVDMNSADAPINVAISLALYCAERNSGPFANQYISFASSPQLITTDGVDFVDKVKRIYDTNLVDNTNLEAVFDLLLHTAISTKCAQEDIPASIIVVSDMQIDTGSYTPSSEVRPMMENMRAKWARYGYQLPKMIYWNVNASKNTVLDDGPDVSYVSGCSPVLLEQILTGKTGEALMYDKLNAERYADIG